MNSGNHTSCSAVGRPLTRLWQLTVEVHTLELLLAVAIFVTIHSVRRGKSQGLATWPLVGMLPSLLLGLRGNMYEWITDVINLQNGTFTFRGPWFTNLQCVVTSDPRNLEHMLKTKFSSFPKGEYFRSTVRDLLGDGIFNADDDAWRQQRKTASLEFHSTAFRAMTAESLVELVHGRLLPVLEASTCAAAAVDLQDVLLRLTFDNVCTMAFGVDPGCLRPGLPEIPFARAFEDATAATIIRFVTPTAIWRSLRFLKLFSERTLWRSLKGVDDFAYEVIRTRKKELAVESDEKKASRSDLLTVFIRVKDDDWKPFSDKFLRDICVNFILAGRDTSSVALAWFFWLLDRNPEVEQNILAEMRRIVEERELRNPGAADQKDGDTLVFRPEEVKKMEYLQAALSEALRLYPSVPVDHKESKTWVRVGASPLPLIAAVASPLLPLITINRSRQISCGGRLPHALRRPSRPAAFAAAGGDALTRRPAEAPSRPSRPATCAVGATSRRRSDAQRRRVRTAASYAVF